MVYLIKIVNVARPGNDRPHWRICSGIAKQLATFPLNYPGLFLAANDS